MAAEGTIEKKQQQIKPHRSGVGGRRWGGEAGGDQVVRALWAILRSSVCSEWAFLLKVQVER